MAEKKQIVKEVRFNCVEMREDATTNELILEGYAVVFNQEAFIGPDDWGWYESIAPTAFNDADMSDVPLRYNHNAGFVILARTRNKSLTLEVDDKGLRISARLQGDVTTHRDIYNMVKTGLIDKMSFAFTVLKDEVTRFDDHADHRYIKKIGKLYDVSIVDDPAYDQTEVFARSRDLVETKARKLDSKNGSDLDKTKLQLEKMKAHILAEV